MAHIRASKAHADNMYVDAQGDIWAHVNGMWRYLTNFSFTRWDGRDELPDCYGPYLELSGSAESFIREHEGHTRT